MLSDASLVLPTPAASDEKSRIYGCLEVLGVLVWVADCVCVGLCEEVTEGVSLCVRLAVTVMLDVLL